MQTFKLHSGAGQDGRTCEQERKEEDMVYIDVVLLFSRIVKARVQIDFKYYSQMQDMDQFTKTWTHSNTLCSVTDNTLSLTISCDTSL